MLLKGAMYTWVETIREALGNYREFSIPEGNPKHDDEWDEICTAMAWIEEELGL